MRDLLKFLLRYSSWMLLAVYLAASCVLLFATNPYQHHLYLTSAGAMASSVYNTAAGVTSYFSLRDINEDLQRRNTELEAEALRLRQVIRGYRERAQADTMRVDTVLDRYRFVIAHVINNSVNRTHNYITLEKGARDGLRPEMGVIDQNGVVGMVNVVGPHTARVISLLNPYLRLSCRVKGQQQVGSLVWDGADPSVAILEELPRHAVFHKGDTVVTSGYSTAFPEGVPVGRVMSRKKTVDDNFYSLRVQLFADFSRLSTVRVVDDRLRPELERVEADAEP